MVPNAHINDDDRTFLLSLARQSIENCAIGAAAPQVHKATLSPELRKQGACFVTLTSRGYLRGCVGALEPYQSLADDVIEHAAAAAFQDYRFPPVQVNELNDIEIEISYLTQPEPLKYENPEELPRLLRPNVDGVVIRDGMRRATFLPQVWEKIPDPEEFLDELCMKMGAPANLWRGTKLNVMIYQVEEFHE
jgi:AmmeMemoRadiSam system protein A